MVGGLEGDGKLKGVKETGEGEGVGAVGADGVWEAKAVNGDGEGDGKEV